MKIIRSVEEFKKIRNELGALSVGFVPTMGGLHKGHLSLIKKAIAENDVSVVSVYLNPTQFNDKKDLETYPANFGDDCKLLEGAGVDYLFAPTYPVMYPDDYAYLGGATEIRSRGLSIPEDISTVGYDGINLSTLIDPTLITWHQNAEEIGRQSARKLIETIEHRKASAAEQISVAGEMLNGCSVRKIDF